MHNAFLMGGIQKNLNIHHLRHLTKSFCFLFRVVSNLPSLPGPRRGMLGCIMAPPEMSESQSLNMLTYMVKKVFAEVIKLRNLRWGDNPGLSGWAQCNQKSPCKRRQEDLLLVDVETEARGWNNPRKEPQNISSP